MNTTYLEKDFSNYKNIFAGIAREINQRGYLVLHDIFPVKHLGGLFIDIKDSDSKAFHSAGIGREQDIQVNNFIRRDRIRWLDQQHTPAMFYFEWMEQLRERLNRELFLGLFDYECHYAHYPKGAFYKKHLDSFRGSSNRKLTTILYLNPDWQSGDGGELVLYHEDGNSVIETVSPTFGTMVIFLSEEFPHEVLPASRSRYSLTGWFRVNSTNSTSLDPGR